MSRRNREYIVFCSYLLVLGLCCGEGGPPVVRFSLDTPLNREMNRRMTSVPGMFSFIVHTLHLPGGLQYHLEDKGGEVPMRRKDQRFFSFNLSNPTPGEILDKIIQTDPRYRWERYSDRLFCIYPKDDTSGRMLGRKMDLTVEQASYWDVWGNIVDKYQDLNDVIVPRPSEIGAGIVRAERVHVLGMKFHPQFTRLDDKISLRVQNMTIREVLTRTCEALGPAYWTAYVVKTNAESMATAKVQSRSRWVLNFGSWVVLREFSSVNELLRYYETNWRGKHPDWKWYVLQGLLKFLTDQEQNVDVFKIWQAVSPTQRDLLEDAVWELKDLRALQLVKHLAVSSEERPTIRRMILLLGYFRSPECMEALRRLSKSDDPYRRKWATVELETADGLIRQLRRARAKKKEGKK